MPRARGFGGICELCEKSVRMRLTIHDSRRYPPKMIPGIDITCCTTATNNRDARLLLSSLGVPFHGKHVN